MPGAVDIRIRRVAVGQMRSPSRNARWPIAGLHDKRLVDASKRTFVVAPLAGVDGRHHFVVDGAARRVRRRIARNAVVHHGAERVDVRPCAKPAAAGILFQRGESRRWSGQFDASGAIAERLSRTADGHPSAAEIEQHGRTIGPHDDVPRPDFLMQKADVVRHFQGGENRMDDGLQALVIQRAFAGENRAQRLAFNVFHDDIPCAVGLEWTVDLGQIRLVKT